MADILVTKGRHRAYIHAMTDKGKKWMEDTYEAKHMVGYVVGINVDYVEDMLITIEMEGEIEVEVK